MHTVLQKYEKTDHDIARSFAQRRCFLKRMKALFIDDLVLADWPDGKQP